MLVQGACQVVKILCVCLGSISHVMNKGEPVVHGHQGERGLGQTYDASLGISLLASVSVCVSA